MLHSACSIKTISAIFTMQNYSRMQCIIFALHEHEKNCTVTPRFNNASPYARKRSATLKKAEKSSLLTTMDVQSRFSTSMLHRGVFMACFIKFMSDVTKKWNIFEIYSRMLFIFTVSIFFLLLLYFAVKPQEQGFEKFSINSFW